MIWQPAIKTVITYSMMPLERNRKSNETTRLLLKRPFEVMTDLPTIGLCLSISPPGILKSSVFVRIIS